MRLAWVVGSMVLGAAVGCGPAVPFDEEADTDIVGSSGSASSVTTTGATTTASTLTTTSQTVTTANPTAPTASASASDSSDPTFPTASVTVTGPTTTTTTATGGGAPNGSECSVDGECASGFCYVITTLGGICGECNSDTDCPDGGCSSPNPLQGTWAECNSGNYAEGCDTTAACEPPLQCAEIIDVPGVLTEATCSECQVDDDCPDGLCQPEYDIPNLTGAWRCVSVGGLDNGEGCALFGSGDQACASGACAAADIMGLVQLGVCSDCDSDNQCPNGQMCIPPGVDLGSGLIPGFCG